jgi:hypothetical protein
MNRYKSSLLPLNLSEILDWLLDFLLRIFEESRDLFGYYLELNTISVSLAFAGNRVNNNLRDSRFWVQKILVNSEVKMI